jgi:hypothetical protein
MNPLMQQMINHKINHMRPNELYQLSQQYHLNLTMPQAEQITSILHRQRIDIGNEAQRKQILQQLATEVDPAIAKKIDILFQQFM